MKTSIPVGDFLKHITNSGGVRKKRGQMSHSSRVKRFNWEEHGDREHTVKGDKRGSRTHQK